MRLGERGAILYTVEAAEVEQPIPREPVLRRVGLLVALCALIWFWTPGLWDLRGPDEARYVQIAKEIRESGNWFHLTLHGQAYDEKAPPPFWFLAAMLHMTGGEVSPWALRMPSIFFSILTVLLCFLTGRHLFGDRAGWLAALVLLTSAQVLDDAPKARLDMMFTGVVLLSLYPLLTRVRGESLSIGRALWMWGALVLAIFIKGPLALIILLSPIIAQVAAERSTRPIREARLLGGLGMALAGLAIAFSMLIQANGLSFVLHQIQEQTIERFLQGSHKAPSYYYIHRVFTSIFLPWGILLIPAGLAIWRTRRSLPKGLAEVLGWVVIPFLVLSLANGKREAYLLPLLPGMALTVGWYLDDLLARGSVFPRTTKTLTVALISTGGILLLCAALAAWRQDLFWNQTFYILRSGMLALGVLGVLLVALGMTVWRRRGLAITPIYGVAGFAVLLALVNYTIINPSTDPQKSTRAFANRIETMLRAESDSPRVIAFGRAATPEYHVYGHYKVLPRREFHAEELHETAPPDFMLFQEDREDIPFDALHAEGFAEVFRQQVSRDLVWVFQRRIDEVPDEASTLVRIAFVGDTAYDPEDSRGVQNAVARVHDRNPLDGYFLLGDVLEGNGTFEEILREQFLDPFQNVLSRHVPIYMALGNHDQGEGLEQDMISLPEFHMRGQDHYMQTFGDELVTFFVLNSQDLRLRPEQVHWLRTSVANCTSRWQVLVTHHPLAASKIAHGADDDMARLLRPILTSRNHIDLVLSGHNHLYERRRMASGIVQIIAGSGCRAIGQPLPPDADREAGSTDRVGFAIATFTPKEIAIEAIDKSGTVFDQAVCDSLPRAEQSSALASH